MHEFSTMTAARVHEQDEREGVGAHDDAVAVGVAGDGGGGWRGGSRPVLRQEDTEASVRRRRRRGLRHGEVGGKACPVELGRSTRRLERNVPLTRCRNKIRAAVSTGRRRRRRRRTDYDTSTGGGRLAVAEQKEQMRRARQTGRGAEEGEAQGRWTAHLGCGP